MIVITTDEVTNKRVLRTLGLVRGNTVRARNLGRDLLAVFRGLIGGEIHEYTKLMAESREQAIDRMCDEAGRLGANAVIRVGFSTSYVASNMAEILVYGTAVVIEDARD